MARILKFLTRTRGGSLANGRIGLTDVLTFSYLAIGVLVVLVPVLWTFLASIKTERALSSSDNRILPYEQVQEDIAGVGTKDIFEYRTAEGASERVFKVGPTRSMTEVAPVDDPGAVFEAPRAELNPAETLRIAVENYLDPILQRNGQTSFHFATYVFNSVFVTVMATLITLVINAMAAFALAKYRFKGRMSITLIIISTLFIPGAMTLVSTFFVVWTLGIFGSLWGVIIPAAATPTGVFLLRQYMLTIPDELLEAARMDAASEWRIFWRIILPLSIPALSVLAILSVIWRWNDFMWPLIVLISDPAKHTIQIGLTTFSSEFDTNLHYVLAMTVVSLIPVTLVFVYLQKFITTGIANTGLK